MWQHNEEPLPDKNSEIWDPDLETLRYTNEPAGFKPSSVYLHSNGVLIHKHQGYEYSPGCLQQEGGFVVKIWLAPFNINWFRGDAKIWGASEEAINTFFYRMGWEGEVLNVD